MKFCCIIENNGEITEGQRKIQAQSYGIEEIGDVPRLALVIRLTPRN